MPLIGRIFSLRSFIELLPFLLTSGAFIGLLNYSLAKGDYQAFRFPRWRFLVAFGLPIFVLGLIKIDFVLILPGIILIIIAGLGTANPNGFKVGFARSWPITLISVALSIVCVMIWWTFGRTIVPDTDENGCRRGEQVWCAKTEECIDPWMSHCGTTATSDAFNVLKKVNNNFAQQLSPPTEDEFTWLEGVNNEVRQFIVSGLTVHVNGGDLNALDQAFIKAGLEPDMVNTNRDSTGGLRGYRTLQTLVCSISFAESVSGAGVDLGISCGRLQK
ncbi:MAG: hypothetical protein V1738_05300 [Patescibacteria group bacterium]